MCHGVCTYQFTNSKTNNDIISVNSTVGIPIIYHLSLSHSFSSSHFSLSLSGAEEQVTKLKEELTKERKEKELSTKR